MEIFQDPQFADYFTPQGGRMTLKLDDEATAALTHHYRGKNTKGHLYILLTCEGGLDPNWPIEHSWDKVVTRAVEAQLVVYSTRSKRAVRPVWYQEPGGRTRENCSWERVRLLPVQRVIDAAGLPVNARVVINN